MPTRVIDLHGMTVDQINAIPAFVYCGRPMRFHRHPAVKAGSPFQNPRRLRGNLRAYREYVLASPELIALLPTLRNRTLACWCADDCGGEAPEDFVCHGQVLALLADGPHGDPPTPGG